MSLKSRVVVRLSLGMPMFAAALFVPAGTWRYWQAWVFLAFALPFLLFAFSYLYKHDREMLERRMRTKEKIKEQRLMVRLLRPAFIAAILIPGLDHRLGWSRTLLGDVPVWLCLIAEVLVAGSWLMVFWVFRVNNFAGRTIEVEAGQPVIASGPYALVRHPMYAASVVMWLFLPLALGSYVAWPVFALLIPFYVFRLLNEEKLLRKELPGYSEYCLHTRFRLVPYLW